MPTVDAAYVALLHDHLTQKGIDPEPLIGRYPDRNARYPVEDWRLMLERAEQVTPAPAFGLQVARCLQVKHFGVLGYLLLACPSMKDALLVAHRYSALVSEHNPMQVDLRDGQIVFGIPHVHGWVSHASDAIGLGAIAQFVRLMTSRDVAASAVDFVAPAPADVGHYDPFFGGPVRFERPMAAIAFPLATLDFPVLHANEGLFQLLDEQAQAKMQKVSPVNALLQGYREQLLPMIRAGSARIDQLAAKNGISARTLQRRLARAGTQFQVLLDETRHHMACMMLADPRMGIVDVAQLMGYTEQSSFTRAFRQWSGQTPGQWRERNAQDDGPSIETQAGLRGAP